MSDRFAKENLTKNIRAVHLAYSKNAQALIPALEDYEKKLAKAIATSMIVPRQNAVAA